jgi:hypothetical protein
MPAFCLAQAPSKNRMKKKGIRFEIDFNVIRFTLVTLF